MTVERSCVLVGSDPQLWTMASLACRPYGALLHSDDRAGALALLGAPHVSAVITESELPDGTGFELASDVRRRAQLPVLLISMRNTHRSVHQAYAAGARYLCMPVARAQLDLFVREAFSHALWPRPHRTPNTAAIASLAREGALTPREIEVVQLAISGRSRLQIADDLGIGARTVKFHVHSLLRKCGAENLSELLRRLLAT